MKEAKKILPKNEYETFEAVFMNQISRTSAAKLKQRATLARKLHGKYRDLAHQQAADVRDRRTNDTDTDLNDRRARLFREVMERLEAELDEPRQESVSATPLKRKARSQIASSRNHALDRRVIHEARQRSR